MAFEITLECKRLCEILVSGFAYTLPSWPGDSSSVSALVGEKKGGFVIKETGLVNLFLNYILNCN